MSIPPLTIFFLPQSLPPLTHPLPLPAGYSIIRVVQLPIKTSQYPTGLSANVLYGRNKAYPEESIFVSNTLSTCVLVLFRMTGANRGLINKSLNFLGGALQDAIELGV